LVPLPEQDRGRWDRELIAEGQDLVRRCLRRSQAGPCQIQAAIDAVHSDAPTAQTTPGPDPPALRPAHGPRAQPGRRPQPCRRGRRVQGPRPAFDLLDGLGLDGYHVFHAVRADLLRRLGRNTEAVRDHEAALALTESAAEHAFLERRARSLTC
jgi:RNA polymerase sigma-70 factor (ECF subfamily)